MEKILNFQMSLFGSFVNIHPNINLTQEIVKNLQDYDFIPSIIVINTLDPAKRNIVIENRLQLISKDRSWNIAFLAERIDFNYIYHEGNNYFSNLKLIIDKGKEICLKVFEKISETKGIRIAVNGRFLVKNIPFDEEQHFIKRFVNIPKIYGNIPVREWNIRFNAPKELMFGDKKDICNNIIEVYEIFGLDSKSKIKIPSMAIGLDINTSQLNTEPKYNYSDIISFSDAAEQMMESLLQGFEGDNL